MTEATRAKKRIQITAEEDGVSTLTLGNSKVEVSADGKIVTLYTNDSFIFTNDPTKAVVSAEAAIISKDFNTVVLSGVTIQAADGRLIINASGSTLINKPAPANDTSVAALMAGSKMADGSIFAGLTADGKQQIFAMPTDLDVTMTFNDAAKAVKKLNNNKALGHDDWQIPSLKNVRVLYKNQNEGALKGTFNTSGNKGSGSGYPVWYWSSTEHRVFSSYVRDVRFSVGNEDWDHKDYRRLSCRPVRLVAAPSPG